MKFKLFNNGFVENVTGRVHYINFEQHRLHVKDQNDNTMSLDQGVSIRLLAAFESWVSRTMFQRGY
ncbi:hypothetical protein JR441_10255 [Bacillus subtilis]|nr:hypothetical protein [Bacillus subtilis]QRQ50483.1 hypothetical protein JR441_10255 [Bacillus subtilis]